MGAGVVSEQPQRTERGGIPIWWRASPGPFWASMMFRVGQADEPLSMRGITHLVEHLSLFPLGRRDHEYNGFVDDARCVFHAAGERDDVLEFLRLTAASLAELPLERLELERRVLRNESAGPDGVYTRMRGHRFGANGYGMPNYVELGLRWLGPEQVTDWARTRFTSGNVVLWMSGEPPEDLGFELPAGERRPAPAPEEIVMQYPAFLAEGTGGVMLTATGARSTALQVASTIAGDRLFDAVRRDRGMAYAPASGYDRLDARVACVMLSSDCQDDDAPAVMEEIWRIVAELGEHGATQEELDRVRRTVERALGDPDAARGELDRLATNELVGARVPSLEELLAEYEALTPEAIVGAARELAASALLLGPEGTSAPSGSFCPYAHREPAVVEGRRYEQRGRSASGPPEAATIDDRGVSYHPPGGAPITIEWDHVAAAEHRPDGGSIVLYARDGSFIVLSSLDFAGGEELLGAVREKVAHVMVPGADAAVAERVEREARERLEEPRLVGGPLLRLAGVLATDEEIAELEIGTYEGVRGLLALTDRRVLWLTPGGATDVALADVRAVKLPRVRQGAMQVVTDAGPLVVDVRPMKRARDIAWAIERRTG